MAKDLRGWKRCKEEADGGALKLSKCNETTVRKRYFGFRKRFWSKMDFIAEEIYRNYLIKVLKLLSQNTPRAVNGGEVHE